jgi:hypothetical protein
MFVQSGFTKKWELKGTGGDERYGTKTRGEIMKKVLTTLIAAAAIGAAAIATSSSADARWGYGYGGWRGGWGWGPGPFVAGALVGGALAAGPYYYGYGPGPYYGYGPGPYYGHGCRRVWNGYTWVRGCY